MKVLTLSPSIQEVEEGESGVQGHSRVQKEFKARRGAQDPVSKQQREEKSDKLAYQHYERQEELSVTFRHSPRLNQVDSVGRAWSLEGRIHPFVYFTLAFEPRLCARYWGTQRSWGVRDEQERNSSCLPGDYRREERKTVNLRITCQN